MLKSLFFALSTYSRIPTPRVGWEEKDMKYSLCFFPLVGVVIGLCSAGLFYGSRILGFGRIFTSAVLSALPIFISGGIHMDGFLDTMDARCSYRSMEEKLRILKDSRAGAFAIMSGVIYLLLYFGAFTEVTDREIGCIAIGYVASRILSGLSVVTLKGARTDGMASSAARAAAAGVKRILSAELIVCAISLLMCDPVCGLVIILLGGLCFWGYRRMAYRIFGGITGDLAGYFLQVYELLLLICAVLVSRLGSFI